MLVIDAGGKAVVTTCIFSDYIENSGDLIINSSTTPELFSVPSIIPSTVELLQGINKIQSVVLEEEE
jgi:hypothetical protein